jgi:hypothetical protein
MFEVGTGLSGGAAITEVSELKESLLLYIG